MQRRYAWVLFSLLLTSPHSAIAQEPQRRVLSGYIREEGSGHVISDVHIQLQNALGTPIAFAYSDGNGAYEFDNMGGDCYVIAEHKGYISSREFVRPDGSGHVYKDIFLRPVNDESASKSGNPVSEHQLSIPPKARESFEKGVQMVVEKSDYRGAVAQFSRAIAKYPSYYEAYAAMGLAQNKMGDAAAAEAAFQKSIELSEEKYPQGMIDLASMYNSQHRYREAEVLLRKVIVLDASSWRGQFELANTLVGLKRIPDAVTCAAAARDLKPDNPPIYLLLYNLHIASDDFPAALRDADAYLKIVPTGPMADRVRKMREQVQKAVPNPPANSPQPPSG
jgi:tetratricopeptide (TPR) repeat protein